MTIAAGKTPYHSYFPGSAMSPEAIPFEYLDGADISVSIVDGAALAEGVHYQLGGDGPTGTGTITALIDAGSDEWELWSETPTQQQIDLAESRKVPLPQYERELDRAAIRTREIAFNIDRTPKVPRGETPPDFASLSGLSDGDLLEFRNGKLQRFDRAPFANKFFAGDALGRPVPSNGIGGADENLRGDLADPNAGARLILATDGLDLQGHIDRQALLVDVYYEEGDGTDWAPAWTRCLEDARLLGRNVRTTPAASYNLEGPIPIWPGALGQTPAIHCDGNAFYLANVSAGFRYRGRKSGALANPIAQFYGTASFDFGDAIASSGFRGIALENGGGWVTAALTMVNVAHGYGVINYRYCDGGAVPCEMICSDLQATGRRINAGDPTWYPFSDTGDLSGAKPGDSIAAGATVMIAVPNAGTTSYAMPAIATAYLWTNPTASAIVVPSLSEANLLAAGLTKGAATDPVTRYYVTAGTERADCPVKGRGRLLRMSCDGGRYGCYLSGVTRYIVHDFQADWCVRGFAGEWGADGVTLTAAKVRHMDSSGILFGYNCADPKIELFEIEVGAEWIGEALINIQLSVYRPYVGAGTIKTANYQATGQYWIKLSCDVQDFNIAGPITGRGDCAKAFVCIESAWNYRLSGSHPEHYPQSSFYDGGVSADMSGGRIGSVRIEATSTTPNRSAALAILQVKDETNGEIGLGPIEIHDFSARSSTFRRYLKIHEGTDAAKRVNKLALRNVFFNPLALQASCAISMEMPRTWGHLSECENVTNLDDKVERDLADGATPTARFGRNFVMAAAGATAVTQIVGGMDSGGNPFAGREISIRGRSGARSLTTASGVVGTNEGLSLKASPLSLTNLDQRTLRYSPIVNRWIEQ